MATQQLLLGVGPKTYEVKRSLRFNNDDSSYIQRTSAPGNTKTWTVSFWMKFCEVTGATNQRLWSCDGNSGTYDMFKIEFYGGSDTNRKLAFIDNNHASIGVRFTTNRKFRDPGAWYHIVLAVDTTQSTAANRVKIYVNGEQETEWESGSEHNHQPNQDYSTSVNANLKTHTWGRSFSFGSTSADYFDGYLADINFIDGLQLAPTSFAETNSKTNQWVPKKYSGSYGTNGYHLTFSDNSNTTSTTLGKDSSGNGNNFTCNNLSTYDSLLDSPTNNFCTMNSAKGYSSAGGSPTFSQGNLQVVTPVSGNGNTAATMSVQSGKWYAEVYIVGYASLDRSCVFVSGLAHQTTSGGNAGEGSNATANIDTGYFHSGMNYKNATEDNSYGASYTTGDIIGVALDLDNRTVNFYKNNTAQGSLSIASWGNWTFGVGDGSGGGGTTHALNFGQESSFLGNKTAQGNKDANGIGDFYYTPPTGYLALCSANLPTPVKLPKQHFNTLIYTGNDSDDRDITGVGFQPDFLWIKNRSQGDWHMLQDAVRGANKVLYSNNTDGEDTDNTNGHVNSFLTDGFNVTAGASGNVNENNENYVAWNWKAGGSTASNSDGSITSTVSANTTAGISIVGWTGTNGTGTVGHGLGVAPKVVIIIRRVGASSRVVYHERAGNGSPETKRLTLDSTSSESSSSANWFNNTAPTSTTFSVGSDGGSNGSTSTYIAYCFSEIEGFSSHGYYVGNGNANGQMILTGFQPAFILTKRLDGTSNWYMWDTKRGYNEHNNPLQANDPGAEPSSYDNSLDILSNGFKFRQTNAGTNGSGDKYIYMAFAELPAKYSRAL